MVLSSVYHCHNEGRDHSSNAVPKEEEDVEEGKGRSGINFRNSNLLSKSLIGIF
jgi:hypothetical protein